ncbi:MAG: glycerophosphodiester phosphodiesterase [Vicinamibacterales bacterium]
MAAVMIVDVEGRAQEAARPLVIGHRGASGHRPEHTLEAYRLAVDMGADFIEPDLVSTRDGVLIARHENEIGGTTDVADRFPERRTTKTIDERAVTGWFSEDFTLAEIRTLRARERLPFRSHAFDGQFGIPTFDEVIELAQALTRQQGRPIGVYPETKHPSYFQQVGLPLEPRLVAALEQRGWNRADAPVFIQSFEVANLRALTGLTPVRLVQLIDAQGGPWDRRQATTLRTPGDMVSAEGLREIREYASGIGVHQRLILPAAADGRLLDATSLVRDAHALGLLVHVWTLRREPAFLSPSYDGVPEREFQQFRALGVDGIFTDFPDVAANAFRATREPAASRN